MAIGTQKQGSLTLTFSKQEYAKTGVYLMAEVKKPDGSIKKVPYTNTSGVFSGKTMWQGDAANVSFQQTPRGRKAHLAGFNIF